MRSYKRNYPYKDLAGQHWPDANIGSSAWYALDIACSVDLDKEVIQSVAWTVSSNGLDVIDQLYTTENVAQVRLEARKAGYYKVTAKVTSLDTGVETVTPIEVYLKVV